MAHIRSSLVLLVSILACSYNVPPTSAQRSVFAYYMLYADVDIGVYKSEIQLAQREGIDAFALNSNIWRPILVDRMYQAAQELGTNFKIFFFADNHKDTKGNLSPDILVTMLNYKSHPNQMRYNGRSLFTSWQEDDDVWWGEFGRNARDGWNDVFQRAGGKDQFHFIPFFSEWGAKGMLNQWDSTTDGLWAWETSAWNPNDKDQSYLRRCNEDWKAFMARVSPWFLKTQLSDSWQVKGDDQGPGLWLSQWQERIDYSIPVVNIVTLKDWAENSYFGPQIIAEGLAPDVTPFPGEARLVRCSNC